MNNLLLSAWVPGLPLILSHEKSQSWKKLHEGFQRLGQHVKELKPDALVIHSSQWLSVLGTSFQTHPNPKGVHVDENWHEWGNLDFNFKSDVALSEAFAKKLSTNGLPTKTVNYDEFPIDTGTIVAMRYLNPDGRIPVSIVSTWVYADSNKARDIGRMMGEVISESGKRTVAIASSLLSTRYFTDEIEPQTDKISNAADDQWNQKILGAFEAGDFKKASELSGEFTKQVPTDMQFNAFHWLSGILAKETVRGRILAYGPQWGTGSAIVEFEGVK